MKKIFRILLLAFIAVAGLSACGKEDPVKLPEITKMIDLHLHLDGAISLESARQLAELQGIEIPEDDAELEELMRVSPHCQDLNEFLEKFAFPCTLIQTEIGLETAVYNLCEELRKQNVIYAEIRFAPQKSCDNGLTQDEVVKAAIKGMKKSSLRANLILCCMRGDMTPENDALNRETLRLTQKYLGQGVCAADLAGAESLYPTSNYEDLFAYAGSLGIPYEIHAGEADGPGSVRSAVAFGAHRIGHGVRSAEDPSLVTELAAKQIPLLVCPTSNIQTCIFDKVSDMPIRTFLDAGVKFCINTDDPSIEGTTLNTEWETVINTFNLTYKEVRALMLNAVDIAFCDESVRAELRSEIETAYP